MAELSSVTRHGYGKITGSGPAGRSRAGDFNISFRGERAEDGVQALRFLAVKPRELAACVKDHGNILRRRTNRERHSEGDIMVEQELVGGGGGGGEASCNGEMRILASPVARLEAKILLQEDATQRMTLIAAKMARMVLQQKKMLELYYHPWKWKSVKAKVVDECDSTMGCDADHDYQPPCANNIVDASKAVWKALGVPEDDWGEMDIYWSDA
ncbi:hypothetical protein GH714_011190 [Hevea brasiliensis]|uniref:Uncharacterized protein n=1 Tax=Hevea brasiliensis TaxID=3981 RepID=A0A6A6N2G8_HEVBR|nr:hypothetical protein GH714_011190 [Hevea brasiliensis]